MTRGRQFLITGCSGGGKSTLLAALSARGYPTVSEPGRRVVEAEQAEGGFAFPWTDMRLFLNKVESLARADLVATEKIAGPVFFDRGVIDAHAAQMRLYRIAARDALGDWRPYQEEVFLAPPWEAIFETDEARRHGFAEAVEEYEHLASLLPELGYRTVELPRVDVAQRVELVVAAIN